MIASSMRSTGSLPEAARSAMYPPCRRPAAALAASTRFDRRAEDGDLLADVVHVELALDVVPGERQQPCDRIAVRGVARRRDRQRPGRIRRHELDLHALLGAGVPAP